MKVRSRPGPGAGRARASPVPVPVPFRCRSLFRCPVPEIPELKKIWVRGVVMSVPDPGNRLQVIGEDGQVVAELVRGEPDRRLELGRELLLDRGVGADRPVVEDGRIGHVREARGQRAQGVAELAHDLLGHELLERDPLAGGRVDRQLGQGSGLQEIRGLADVLVRCRVDRPVDRRQEPGWATD